MDTPRLHGYPIDQQVVAQARAKSRARQAARLEARAARRESRERHQYGVLAFFRWFAPA